MQTMLAALLLTSVIVAGVALLYARNEYLKRGRLTWLGVFLLCAMLFLPNLVLHYATRYKLPSTALDFLGIVVGLLGLIFVFVGIFSFRSLTKMLCLRTGELTRSGPYRWSRNPQYVGYWLFLLGFALNDWSLWCLAALAVVAISLHLLVLIEEEHLQRVFGEPYAAFARMTPRYVRIW